MEIKSLPVVITGGASGMGAATAKLLAGMGAKVTILDTNQSLAEKLVKDINGLAVVCDVTSEESVSAALNKIIDQYGNAPRVCINCAGIIFASRLVGKDGPMSLADFKKVIDINLVGTFNVMRIMSAAMSKLDPINSDHEQGLIINTSSIAAFEGQLGQVAYSASKGGVASMTLPVARELARFGIRVVAVAPGLINTPMISELSTNMKNQLENSTIFPWRLGEPDEFAKFIQHIIENPLINGDVLRLDGAVRLR